VSYCALRRKYAHLFSLFAGDFSVERPFLITQPVRAQAVSDFLLQYDNSLSFFVSTPVPLGEISWLHYKGPLPAPAPTARQQRRLKDKEKKKALEKQGKQAIESWNQLSLSCAKAVQECSALKQSLLNRS